MAVRANTGQGGAAVSLEEKIQKAQAYFAMVEKLAAKGKSLKDPRAIRQLITEICFADPELLRL